MRTRGTHLLALAAAIGLNACTEGGGELELESTELVHASTGAYTLPTHDRTRKVDILFVIDNSSSMAEEQGKLAANFGAFIQVLESEDVELDYRVAITTTDSGNPACDPQLTTPEHGALVMSSCLERLDDFVDEDQDARALACEELCALDAGALEIQPTTTAGDEVPRPRPWLEHAAGQLNLPAGTSPVEAFECFAPQGITGCSFESPLESMYGALTRSMRDDDPARGFMRHDASLAVIFVTDEADCSHAEAFGSIFEAGGDTSFWPDPSADAPSSAVCWNAGVECEGDPSSYDSCEPVNKNTAGELGVDDEDAVLRPISRYRGLLEGIERDKQRFDPNARVVVSLIGGVTSDGTPVYADGGELNAEFHERFGIGPGCTGLTGPDTSARAVPPVRLRALTDAFTPHNMFSICDGDYTPALYSLVPHHGPQIAPACYDYCAQDTDPSTDALEPACVIEEDPIEGGARRRIQECRRDAGGYVIEGYDFAMPSDEVDVCYAMMTDELRLTESTADDMSDYCSDSGHNLEFKIARRPGSPRQARITATCTLSPWPSLDCPGLED